MTSVVRRKKSKEGKNTSAISHPPSAADSTLRYIKNAQNVTQGNVLNQSVGG
jgi:hypothetical protein